jgi:uncharacterized protein YkwD
MPALTRVAISPRSGFLLAMACAVALIATPSPVGAGEADLGNYFQSLPKGVPPIKQRAAAPRAKAVAPLHRASFVTTAPIDTSMLEQSAFTLINLHRISKGMRPLGNHSGLADRARSHSANMASGAAPMNHDGMRNRLSPFMGLFGARAGGEILAFNRNMGDPARTAMMSWLNSYRHKDIIEEDYTRVGVGVVMRPDGGYYFTALFIR